MLVAEHPVAKKSMNLLLKSKNGGLEDSSKQVSNLIFRKFPLVRMQERQVRMELGRDAGSPFNRTKKGAENRITGRSLTSPLSFAPLHKHHGICNHITPIT